MKSIIDNKTQSKTFVLYGNLKDTIWCHDLIPRDFEHYIVKLLKNRGYKHVIFFGEAGTKGAYCLDETSARFFFSENFNLPKPKLISNLDLLKDEESKDTQTSENQNTEEHTENNNDNSTSDVTTGSQVMNSLGSLLGDDESDDDGYNPSMWDNENETLEEPVSQNVQTQHQGGRIRYSSREKTIGEFVNTIEPLMSKQDSHMAVVFYNISTTELGSQTSLRDCITSIWENSACDNICLLLAPETDQNITNTLSLLRNARLGDKFLIDDDCNNSVSFNKDNCFKIGPPEADEFKNMFRYLSLIGTKHHRKITFNYCELDDIVSRVIYALGNCKHCYMNDVYAKLEAYINNNAKINEPLHINIDEIDKIWKIRKSEQKAIEKLNREGWQPVYNKVKHVIQSINRRKQNRLENLKATSSNNEKDESVDWCVNRLLIEKPVSDDDLTRESIPNFIITGAPGQGKTTIGRIIGEVLREEGVLKKGHVEEITKKDLTNEYRSGTLKQTERCINRAEEGVLFIDEAQDIAENEGGLNSDGTTSDILSTLNSALTDPNHHFSLVLSGHEEGIKKLLDNSKDPGFARRFNGNYINLEPYEPPLLKKILLRKIKRDGYKLDPDLMREIKLNDEESYIPLECMIQRVYNNRDLLKFGNAGTMVAIAEDAEGKSGDDKVVYMQNFCGFNDGTFEEKISEEWFSPLDYTSSTKDILSDMDKNIIGMQRVKKEIYDISEKLKENQKSGRSNNSIRLKPFLLIGNPGTGKSMLPPILSKIYFKYGILASPKLIKVSATSLVGYEINKKIKELIEKSQNTKRLLFIDEFSSLLGDERSTADARTIVTSLLAPITDAEHPVFVCIALYPQFLENFKKLDPGVNSRYKIIKIDDYTGEELMEIFEKKLEVSNLRIAEDAKPPMLQLFNYEAGKNIKGDEGNGRFVEKIIEEMNTNRISRSQKMSIDFNDPKRFVFSREDIPEKYKNIIIDDDEESKIQKLMQMQKEIEDSKVGYDSIKKELIEKLKIVITRHCRKIEQTVEPGHYFFIGEPGTGKSTGVEFFAKYLHKMGLISNPVPYIRKASDLVSGFIGQTKHDTKNVFEEAIGGVLFIDEAYSLACSDGFSSQQYNKDCIDEIINILDDEKFRRTTSVIFAGYPSDMNKLYESNRGFRGRVREIKFDNFSLETSKKVMEKMIENKKLNITQETLSLCINQIEILQNNPNFENGRTIRSYVDLLENKVSNRIFESLDNGEIADDLINTIIPDDIPTMEEVFAKTNLKTNLL